LQRSFGDTVSLHFPSLDDDAPDAIFDDELELDARL
jgi:hypothetical protein